MKIETQTENRIRIYFDTSAIVKEFHQENGSEYVDRLTTRARENKVQIISSQCNNSKLFLVILCGTWHEKLD